MCINNNRGSGKCSGPSKRCSILQNAMEIEGMESIFSHV